MRGSRVFVLVVCIVGLSVSVSALTVNWTIGPEAGCA